MYRFLLSIILIAGSISAFGEKFPQVLLAGDYPDPSILRDGKDYYMTHSPFHYTPGFLIWHSTDLKNWEPICRALPEFKGSAMAPDLIKHGDRYYIYYPSAGTNWVTWADDIRGPWSEPVDLKVSGIDPGHIADKDGNRYLYVNEGEIIRLTSDGLSTIGEKKKVYDGWVYPEEWDTEGMYLESPKLTYHNGYYYLTSAEGGTAGPATSHMVASARSKNIDGPWENSPYNPIVHTYTADDEWWSKGHGTIIDDTEGNWWIVYHGYRNGYHTLGRSTLIEPITWTADGWFHAIPEADYPQTANPVKNGMKLSDDFSGDKLGLQWTLWEENGNNSVSFTGNSIKVKGKGTNPADSRLILTTPQHKNYVVETEVSVGKNSTAGLLLYYNDKAYAGLTSNGKNFFIYTTPTDKKAVPNKIGRHFFVRLHNQGNRLSISVSKDGKEWSTIASGINVKDYHHNIFKGFYALRPALSVSGKGLSEFHDFKYSHGVPGEDELTAYLMVFHKDKDHGLYMAYSNDGYIWTALNNDRPIMSADTIAEQKGIRDPYIFRTPDGGVCMAMTDLHVFGQETGIRNTKWERPEKYGWGNNRGLVLFKSYDFINWKRSNLDFSKLKCPTGQIDSEGNPIPWSEVGCVWAPEMIIDDNNDKIMLHFTTRFGNGRNMIYYVYMNDDFSEMTCNPQFLYSSERDANGNLAFNMIDSDIIKIEDTYHLFSSQHGFGKHATSKSLTGPYEPDINFSDHEQQRHEALTAWKSPESGKWIIMFDNYSHEPHNFGFIETSDFKDFTPLGYFDEEKCKFKRTNFSGQKHGGVIRITHAELDRILKYWE